MGFRLEGAAVADGATRRAHLRRDAARRASGAAAGQPILLMADHATTGGYPIAATVIAADMPIAGQLAPGDWIAFVVCTPTRRDAALRQQEARA